MELLIIFGGGFYVAFGAGAACSFGEHWVGRVVVIATWPFLLISYAGFRLFEWLDQDTPAQTGESNP